MLLFRDRFAVTKPLSQIQRSTLSPLQDADPTPSFGGFGFTNVTSVPVEMTHTGVEPPLSIEARSLLFSIAHNALTNAYRHAKANRVAIDLEFAENHSRLSVADDGVGLPDDYAERGNGFANMSRAAERRRASRGGTERRHGRRGRDLRCTAGTIETGTIEKGGPGCRWTSA